jgi:hypothetical protein
VRCHGVHDLAVAEAQYHICCYDKFRKLSLHADQTSMIDDEGMTLLVDEVYTNGNLYTLISIELPDKYASYGGQVIRKQTVYKLDAHLGSGMMVLVLRVVHPLMDSKIVCVTF